ncbi:MAG: hypothetical protein WC679_13855 [Bacteroidales bacterium]
MKALPTAKSYTDAARQAGYKGSGTEVLDRVTTKEGFKECLIEVGLDYDALARFYAEIIKTGKNLEKLKAMELLHKIRGDFAPTEIKTTENFEDYITKQIKVVEDKFSNQEEK